MTIGYSTKWPKSMGQEYAGKQNQFVQKIWAGLLKLDYDLYSDYLHPEARPELIKSASYYKDFQPKKHTLRHDPKDRWKVGMKIHPVINNRTKNRFQFAPVLEVKSIQKIEIKYTESSSGSPLIYIGIDNKCFDTYNMVFSAFGNVEKLAINDGFPSVEAFFAWFNKDFSGKIIHWTDYAY